MNNMIFAGVDDGYACIKIAFKESKEAPIKTDIFPSWVQPGIKDKDTNGALNDTVYETEGKDATVMNVRGMETRFADYQYSDYNRVLVHHALYEAEAAGKGVVLMTGLPPGDYYKAGTGKNDKLIEMKRRSMLLGVRRKNESIRPLNIISSEVAPEALSAVIDWSTTDDLEKAVNLQGKLIAVIDVGGKTTDIVSVNCKGKQMSINPLQTVSMKIGLLKAQDAVLDLLAQHEDADRDHVQNLESMFQTKTVKISGTIIDASQYIDEAVASVSEELQRAVSTIIGKATEFDHVLLVGGGAEVFRSSFKYRNLQVPIDPQFSNARGMLKLAFISAERRGTLAMAAEAV